MPDSLAQLSLGKPPTISKPQDLKNVIQLEHIRNYALSSQKNEAKDEFIIQIDNNKH